MNKGQDKTEKIMNPYPSDEVYEIDGITIRLYYAKESNPTIMEKLEKLLWENMLAR